MTLTVTNRGENNDTTPDITLTPSGNLAAGSMAVLIIGGDNRQGNDVLLDGTITDTQGNTWTVQQQCSDNAGTTRTSVELYVATTNQDGGALTTSDTITVPIWDSNGYVVVGLWEVAGSVGTPTYKAGNKSVETNSDTVQITTDSITSEHALIAATCWEYSGTPTADSDTTNGSWSTQMYEQRGSFSSGVGIVSQYKVVTGTGTQSYDVTLPAAVSWYAAWIEVEEVTAPTGIPVYLIGSAL